MARREPRFPEGPPAPKAPKTVEDERVLERQLAFGYTYEDLRMLLGPTAATGVQPIGSMGNDTPLAVLSEKPKHLYQYFKQIFAQVTNPALDCIREELVTATETFLGSEGNLLEPGPKSCRMIRLDHPLLDNQQLAKLREIELDGFKSITLDALFPADQGGAGLEAAFDKLCAKADQAIEDGYNLLIVSDRNIDAQNAAMPTLLVMGGLHHYLVKAGSRTKVSIILETGEAREVHHFSCLIGYGADAINPYMAFDSIHRMIEENMLDIEFDKAVYNFLKGSIKGVVKTMAKMGISTVASYRGAQIFETIGLSTDLVNKFFTGTSSRCEGSDIDQVAEEALVRHREAFPDRHIDARSVPSTSGGVYQWRSDGEYHLFNPETIHLLQKAVRTGSYEVYKQYAAKVNDRSQNLSTLRGLMKFKGNRTRFRSRKWSRSRRSRNASRPGRCPTVRFRRRPTKPRHRDEPHRREVEHGRGRRGSGALQAAPERRQQALRDQAGRLGPLRRHQRIPRQRR